MLLLISACVRRCADRMWHQQMMIARHGMTPSQRAAQQQQQQQAQAATSTMRK
jgi:hypothetical protein